MGFVAILISWRTYSRLALMYDLAAFQLIEALGEAYNSVYG